MFKIVFQSKMSSLICLLILHAGKHINLLRTSSNLNRYWWSWKIVFVWSFVRHFVCFAVFTFVLFLFIFCVLFCSYFSFLFVCCFLSNPFQKVYNWTYSVLKRNASFVLKLVVVIHVKTHNKFSKVSIYYGISIKNLVLTSSGQLFKTNMIIEIPALNNPSPFCRSSLS